MGVGVDVAGGAVAAVVAVAVGQLSVCNAYSVDLPSLPRPVGNCLSAGAGRGHFPQCATQLFRLQLRYFLRITRHGATSRLGSALSALIRPEKIRRAAAVIHVVRPIQFRNVHQVLLCGF